MKRPSFQFYPADWKNNSKLRRCSEAARGAWVDVLCLLHDSDEYGVCRWPLDELARAASVPLKLVKELVAKDVLKGAAKNAAPYIFTPRHAGKNGEPVTLVTTDDQPCWYCSRFVRDEYIRQRRGQSTQFTADNQPPKNAPKEAPKGGIGERDGDGSTSASTSTSKSSVPIGTDGKPSKSPEELAKIELWKTAVAVLQAGGCDKEAACRSFMGALVKDYTLEIVREAVNAAEREKPASAREYLKATCQRLAGERLNKQESLEQKNAQVAAQLAEEAA